MGANDHQVTQETRYTNAVFSLVQNIPGKLKVLCSHWPIQVEAQGKSQQVPRSLLEGQMISFEGPTIS